ncbi:MAG: CDK5RAP3 family protein, partial [Spirochaetaceae bacterium]|nr:CDK5RAP3 family protein [Spirochaetaceae bacterium]
MPSRKQLEEFTSSFKAIANEAVLMAERHLPFNAMEPPERDPPDAAPESRANSPQGALGGQEDFGLAGDSGAPPENAGFSGDSLEGDEGDLDFGAFLDTIPDDLSVPEVPDDEAGIPDDLLSGFADEIESEAPANGSPAETTADTPAEDIDFGDTTAAGDADFGDTAIDFGDTTADFGDTPAGDIDFGGETTAGDADFGDTTADFADTPAEEADFGDTSFDLDTTNLDNIDFGADTADTADSFGPDDMEPGDLSVDDFTIPESEGIEAADGVDTGLEGGDNADFGAEEADFSIPETPAGEEAPAEAENAFDMPDFGLDGES